jgi:hypothetical protein
LANRFDNGCNLSFAFLTHVGHFKLQLDYLQYQYYMK